MEGYAETLPRDFVQRYLAVPKGSQRVADLAERVAGDAIKGRDIANKIQRFLSSEGGYQYSLEQPDVGDRDPLHVFLFDAKRGHCEYYSTAMAIMLRTRGIPARNVTGFLGADYNPYGDYYAVRNSNAHSWVEALIDGRWTTFDPTPADAQIAASPSGLLVRFQHALDAMRIRWAEYVVEYSIRDQSKALSWIISRYQDFKAKRRTKGKADKKDRGDFDAWNFDKRWLVVPVMLAFFFFAFLLIRMKGRKGDTGPGLRGDQLRAFQLYRELESKLGKVGKVRGPSVTPQELADELKAEAFDGNEIATEVTDAYLATRFGGEPLCNLRLQELRKRVSELQPRR